MSLRQWTGGDRNEWRPIGDTHATLPPAFYEVVVRETMMGNDVYLSKIEPKHDKAIVIGDSASNRIIEQIKKFHSSKDLYAKFKMLHKRGLLLEGPAGSGKTMASLIAGEYVVENNGIVIMPVPHIFAYLSACLQAVRQVHPDLFMLCVIEDIDHHIYRENVERLLSLLDGSNQLGNCFFVATTNHIGKIDERLTNRPKRFDEVIHVGPPSEAARRSYLEQIVPADTANRTALVTKFAKASEGLMLAHLAEMVVSHCVLAHTIDEAATRLKKMNTPPNDDDILGKKNGKMYLEISTSSLKRK